MVLLTYPLFIAVAVRAKVPIFIDESVLDEAGIIPEPDIDEEVSPDSADPEQFSETDRKADENSTNGNVTRVSTREWAIAHDYDPKVNENLYIWF